MRPEIEARIREVYTSGRFSVMDRAAFLPNEYNEFVFRICADIEQTIGFKYWQMWEFDCDRALGFTFSLPDDPPFPVWLDSTNASKLQWIEKSGRFYPVLWLWVSRIWPTYNYYYNIWKPRDATGYLDIDITIDLYHECWLPFFTRGFALLHTQGIIQLSHEELIERVPFVLGEDWDDIEDETDDEVEPRLIETTVSQCLLQTH